MRAAGKVGVRRDELADRVALGVAGKAFEGNHRGVYAVGEDVAVVVDEREAAAHAGAEVVAGRTVHADAAAAELREREPGLEVLDAGYFGVHPYVADVMIERARDAVRGAILARALTPDLTRRAQALSAQLAQVALLRREAAAANESLLNAQSAEADRSVDIANALRERQALDPAAASLGPLSEGGAKGDLSLAWPIGGTVTQRFGAPLAAGGRSSGLSISGRRGATVVSPTQGTVDFVGPVQGWGLVLILRVRGAYHLVLGGLDEVSVAVGQSVAPGGAVGRLPNGAKSDPQLYMEVRENGAPVDPARWMSGAPLGSR